MTIKDIIEEWLFERLGPRYRLVQNKSYGWDHLWAVIEPNGRVTARIDVSVNEVSVDGKTLSFHDPAFFENLEKSLRL